MLCPPRPMQQDIAALRMCDVAFDITSNCDGASCKLAVYVLVAFLLPPFLHVGPCASCALGVQTRAQFPLFLCLQFQEVSITILFSDQLSPLPDPQQLPYSPVSAPDLPFGNALLDRLASLVVQKSSVLSVVCSNLTFRCQVFFAFHSMSADEDPTPPASTLSAVLGNQVVARFD